MPALNGIDFDMKFRMALEFQPISFLLEILDSQYLMKNPVIEDVSFVIFETVKKWLSHVMDTRDEFKAEEARIDAGSLREIVLQLLSNETIVESFWSKDYIE